MNFNPMDLIKIKDFFYSVNSIPFDNISNFINKLLEIQKDHMKVSNLKKKKRELYIDESKSIEEFIKFQDHMGDDFFKKQEMIEKSYNLCKLDFKFLKNFSSGEKH